MVNETEGAAWARLLGVTSNASTADVCRAFEQLVKSTLAPQDLRGIPFYALSIAELPNEHRPIMRHFGGIYVELGFWTWRKFIPSDSGPGPLVVVDDLLSADRMTLGVGIARALCKDKRQHFDEEETARIVQESMLPALANTLVHEAAHALDLLPFWLETADLLEGFRGADRGAVRIAEDIVRLQETQHEPPPLNPLNHGPSFVRVMAHLDERLRRIGVRMGNPFPSERYGGQPTFDRYRMALTSELQRSPNRSFAEITKRRPPRAFRNLAALAPVA